MSVWMSAAIAGVLLITQAPAAADPAPPPAETTIEGLVVTARPAAPPVDAITAFVAEVSAPGGNRRLARWDRKICPGVIGLKRAYAERLIDRIATHAYAVGLDVGEPGCQANMIIVATDDAQTLARKVVDDNPVAFARYETGSSRGRSALKTFTDAPRPVRWWHVTRTVGADGQRYERGGQMRVRQIGRLRATTRDDFNHVIILVDVKRTGVINFAALADYVAMIGLAQIEPDADAAGVATILNLFADRDRGVTPAGHLTAWDLAYLQGLYGARRDAERDGRQKRDIVDAMVDGLKAPAPPEDK